MESNNNDKYWSLIAKYLSDECNDEETDNLFTWVNQSEENKILFNQAKQDLKIINMNKPMEKINVDSAWEKLKGRIMENEETMPVKEVKERKLTSSYLLKYAAAIIFLVSVGFFATKIYRNYSYYSITEITAKNETKENIKLPDGTLVSLNVDSELQYPEKFTGKERKVKLIGEGYFNVTKNPNKPFIIETNDAQVKVLGTSFNVNTRHIENDIEVFVETGLVELSRKNNSKEKLLIKPGRVGAITNKGFVKSVNNNKNIIAWKTREIVFREDKVSDVIHILNAIYNTDIVCENQKVLDLKYTSTFNNQELSSVLNVICVTFDLKIEHKGDKIYLIKYDS